MEISDLLLRPVRKGDIDQVVSLATLAKVGLTSLPADKGYLTERIEESVWAFEHMPSKPDGSYFLFVLEDITTHKLVGTSALYSKVGGYYPFYSYELKSRVHTCATLKKRKRVHYLKLKYIHDGPSEIGTLFLHPQYRGHKRGRLLSLGRFLFMALYPQVFEKRVIAEMRGVIDEQGQTVFWDAIGSHFFDMPFAEADVLVNTDKRFIADLMPKHPIYIELLPQSVQQVIGKTHPMTTPALEMLQKEGFRFINEVDIFEGGPLVGCNRDDIRTIQESISCELHAGISREHTHLVAGCNPNSATDFWASFGVAYNPGGTKNLDTIQISENICNEINMRYDCYSHKTIATPILPWEDRNTDKTEEGGGL